MSEISDIILPVLRRVQADIADIKTGQQGLAVKFDDLSERMSTIEGYITYALGITSRQSYDIEQVQAEVKALAARVPPAGTAP